MRRLSQLSLAFGVAFLVGQFANGNTRYCYYDYMGQEIVQSIPTSRLCPLTIRMD